ncbi:MAG: hypothetical protein QXV21_02775 [Candidatus Bathyarchaeia archaeon]
MYRVWAGRNVDLALLSDRVRDFLKKQGFKCKEKRVDGDYSRKEFSCEFLCGRVFVRIFGFSNNFTVELDTPSLSSSAVASGFTLFGSGAFVLRELQSKEAYDALEKKFWAFIEDAVDRLENSCRVQS